MVSRAPTRLAILLAPIGGGVCPGNKPVVHTRHRRGLTRRGRTDSVARPRSWLWQPPCEPSSRLGGLRRAGARGDPLIHLSCLRSKQVWGRGFDRWLGDLEFEPRLPGSEPGVLPLNYPPPGQRATHRNDRFGPSSVARGENDRRRSIYSRARQLPRLSPWINLIPGRRAKGQTCPDKLSARSPTTFNTTSAPP